MDYRKSNAPTNMVTRDMMKLSEETGNVYETDSDCRIYVTRFFTQLHHVTGYRIGRSV